MGMNMHIFGLAIFPFGITGGIYEKSHRYVFAYFKDDCLKYLYTCRHVCAHMLIGKCGLDFKGLD